MSFSSFLQFQDICKNNKEIDPVNNEPPPSKKQRIKKKVAQNAYRLPTFGKTDLRSMPMGYSTPFPPSSNGCDNCGKILNLSNEGIVLTCGHGYHSECYNEMERKCKHCLEYYKEGIQKNVREFLKRLNMGTDKLTDDDLNEDEERDENDLEEEPYYQLKMDRKDNLSLALQKKIDEINSW